MGAKRLGWIASVFIYFPCSHLLGQLVSFQLGTSTQTDSLQPQVFDLFQTRDPGVTQIDVRQVDEGGKEDGEIVGGDKLARVEGEPFQTGDRRFVSNSLSRLHNGNACQCLAKKGATIKTEPTSVEGSSCPFFIKNVDTKFLSAVSNTLLLTPVKSNATSGLNNVKCLHSGS